MRLELLFLLLLLAFPVFSSPDSTEKGVWLLVDTEAQYLEIKQGKKTVAKLDNIAIGRGGAGFKNRQGDDITPNGTYRIGWINNKSPFYRFYGFDYPSVENAHEALLSGLISKKNHTSIINAHKRKQIPPQNTPIGGRIGIHGLGKGDKEIHKLMNWTHGCIALTNKQIDKLDRWISTGIVVKIK